VRPEIRKEFERASELSLIRLPEHKEAGGKAKGATACLRQRDSCGQREQSR